MESCPDTDRCQVVTFNRVNVKFRLFSSAIENPVHFINIRNWHSIT